MNDTLYECVDCGALFWEGDVRYEVNPADVLCVVCHTDALIENAAAEEELLDFY